MSIIFGPDYNGNKSIIDNNMAAGQVISAADFQTVLSNLNLSGKTIGNYLGDYEGFNSAPFSVNATFVQNILAGYNATLDIVSAMPTATNLFLYRNYGGF